MIGLIILIAAYIIGLLLSFWMIRVEYEAEGNVYTKGDRVVNIAWSLLSWITVIVVLIKSWYATIGKTGYWDKPVKEEKAPEVVIIDKSKTK